MTGSNWRRRAAIAVCATAMFLLGFPTNAGAQDAPQGDVEIVSFRFDPTDRLERWLGGTVRGNAVVTVANTGTEPITVDDAGVVADGRTYLLPPLELEPGRVATVSTLIDLGGLSLAERDVAVYAGDASAALVHREIPWILVGLVGFAINTALLAGRDLLRRRVRRQLAAVSA